MIRLLKKDDISKVAGIHSQELSGFLPELGEEFLDLFYEKSMDLPEMFTFIEVEKDAVYGFVSNITDTAGLYKKILFKDPLKFISIIMKHFIAKPRDIIKFYKILTYPGFHRGGAELLSIAVSSRFQKKGIGRKLFEKSAAEFKKRGIKKFKISVYDRLPANGFYNKMGCTKIATFDFLDEKMNYFEYKI